MNIFDLSMGQTAVITKINLGGGAKDRLFSLGVKEGERVEVISYSLLKSSVLISCAAVRVGIRKGLARKIEVRL